jgi:hypothetical protein
VCFTQKYQDKNVAIEDGGMHGGCFTQQHDEENVDIGNGRIHAGIAGKLYILVCG